MAPRQTSAPPTNELGQATHAQGLNPLGRGVIPWSQFIDEIEYVPELFWPMSVRVYNQMRNDAQLSALHRGTTMPIRRFKWLLDPNGARPEIVQKLSTDYGLNIVGQEPKPRGRQRGRFNFHEHMRLAFLALIYGHNFFEQVGRIQDDGLWHLRKLAERLPQTIQEIGVAPDGGLVYIKQNLPASRAFGELPEIPVDRLVGYVWDKEGGNWAGRSMMRECYRDWLIKDRLKRIDVVNHERAGGIPWIESPPNATPSEMAAHAQMASQFRVGENSGGALPAGAKLNLARIGSGSDVIDSIRECNEEMARHYLMMFIQLGQTQTGSRALGDTFMDFFVLGQEAVANWLCDTFNQHVIEDDVDWNYGEDVEEIPLLTYERSHDNEELPTADLVSLIDAKALVVDEELEAHLRHKYNLPGKKAGAPTPEELIAPPAPPSPGVPGQPAETPPGSQASAKRRGGPVKASETGPSLMLPDRPLRRQPYDHEVRASVDFASLDVAWQSEVGLLVQEWQAVRKQQIDELSDAVKAAKGSVKKLSKIAASPLGADLIYSRMQNMASQGIAQAMAEASRQGVVPKSPSAEGLADPLASRASSVESLMATAISETAARRAILVSELDPVEAAAEVKSHLQNLSDAFLHDQLGGALMAAQNSGRRLVMRENDAKQIYASELLDANTCEHCVARDGHQYPDLLAAEHDYPTGGYKECLGGPRCRGTLVAVYEESA